METATHPGRRGRRATVLLAAMLACLAAGPARALADDPAAPPDALGTPEPCDDPNDATLAPLDCSGLDPVPSLDPAATATPRAVRPSAAAFAPADADLPASCRLASDVVFYAQRDWRRLAQTLVGDASPCANFYIDVPPIVPPNGAPKLDPRRTEPPWLHALGPTVHALNEVHLTSWSRWRVANGASWFDAGVEARHRMDAAGFSVFLGDLWAVNEVPSTGPPRRRGGAGRPAVLPLWPVRRGRDGRPLEGARVRRRRGPGNAAHQRVQGRPRGLAAGLGVLGGMDRYVGFFAQEVYPDSRTWGVADATRVRARPRTSATTSSTSCGSPPRGPTPSPPHATSCGAPTCRSRALPGAGRRPTGTPTSTTSRGQFVSEETFAIRSYAGSQPARRAGGPRTGAPGRRTTSTASTTTQPSST